LHVSGDTAINLKAPAIKYNKWQFSRLEFDENKADIKFEMQHDLDKIVDFLVDHPTFLLKISGHTDSNGNPDQNLRLSQKRADAIKFYILNKGKISPKRVEAIGYGNQKPIVKEVEDEHKHINRRVEFEMIDPDKDR
jgi:outer membrane protein OmpA-like peptidoglycan-associated protein